MNRRELKKISANSAATTVNTKTQLIVYLHYISGSFKGKLAPESLVLLSSSSF